MAQSSYPWQGLVTGDCGAYSADTLRKKDLYTLLGDNEDWEGVLAGALSQLVGSSPSANTVRIASGAAYCAGFFYLNTANVDTTIPTPVGATRIDRVVLQANWAAQTVRIARLAGVEGGAAPSVTQTDGVTWEIMLYHVSITTGGVITLTDERGFINPQAPIFKRKGGSETNWGTGGATVFRPRNTVIQCGAETWSGGAAVSGAVDVTLPEALTYVPLFIVTPHLTSGTWSGRAVVVAVDTPDTAGFRIVWYSANGSTTFTSITFNWIALGLRA